MLAVRELIGRQTDIQSDIKPTIDRVASLYNGTAEEADCLYFA